MRLLKKQLRCPSPSLLLMIVLIHQFSFFLLLCCVGSSCKRLKNNSFSWVACHCIQLSRAKGMWTCIYFYEAANRRMHFLKWPVIGWIVCHSINFLKPECRAKKRCGSLVYLQTTWISKCWKGIMEFLPNDAKNKLPTPALICKQLLKVEVGEGGINCNCIIYI